MESVEFLYRTNPNVICISSDRIGEKQNEYKCDIKKIGHDHVNHFNTFTEENFEEMFYRHANMDFKCKANFHLDRDLNRENEFFKKCDVDPYSYVFVHEYTDRVKIDPEYLPDCKIIRAAVDVHSPNIFDYITLINFSQEVHVIESSFLCLIDLCRDIINPKLYNHRYAKTRTGNVQKDWEMPKLLKPDWTIYT
tara:strand:- start:26 stop:607 length:582 start_codon:yes stop_codon:yes gene_type:complete